uniref:homeodomain-interacting protein kinase 1-like n=1 Tax=Monopterus albus TaxID=43700 RepID=UPI0009B4C398|nr:homeodomain-interacting protein kinase 1-like [Monopterus albus]
MWSAISRSKVIDFSLACNVSAAMPGSYIFRPVHTGPRGYWETSMSVGCMAALMYLGTRLYPGRHEYDMMRCIVETQGPGSREMHN